MFGRSDATYDSCCSLSHRRYVQTSTSRPLREVVNMDNPWASGKFIGWECKDHVILSAPDH